MKTERGVSSFRVMYSTDRSTMATWSSILEMPITSPASMRKRERTAILLSILTEALTLVESDLQGEREYHYR